MQWTFLVFDFSMFTIKNRNFKQNIKPTFSSKFQTIFNVTDHGHEVVNALDPCWVGEEVHDEVAEVAAVRRGHDLHRRLQVLALNRKKRVAGQS